jgi:hypothetical protein
MPVLCVSRAVLTSAAASVRSGIQRSAGYAHLDFPMSLSGQLECVVAVVILSLGYTGLHDWRAIGYGWVVHSIWDAAHHLKVSPWDTAASYQEILMMLSRMTRGPHFSSSWPAPPRSAPSLT